MTVLTYHKIIDQKNFERQLNFLYKKKYNVISLGDFSHRLVNRELHAKDILITFDDGDYSVFENALPILKKYGYPAVLFVITELIDSRKPFWWDEILFYTNDASKVVAAKQWSNDERLIFLETLRSSNVSKPLEYRQLSLQELRSMEGDGIVICNHSHTHPMFDKISSSQIESELLMSSNFLKNNGFRNHDVFAYPNGNYSDDSEKVLIELKTRLAFLFDHKSIVDISNPLRLSRLSVNDHTPLWKYDLILKGWHSRLVPAIKKIHRLISR